MFVFVCVHTCAREYIPLAVQVQIADLSINGVFVNDKKIGRPTDISAGDVVTFGHIRGAALSAGTHASQPESEFQFRVSAAGRLYSVLRYSNMPSYG